MMDGRMDHGVMTTPYHIPASGQSVDGYILLVVGQTTS